MKLHFTDRDTVYFHALTKATPVSCALQRQKGWCHATTIASAARCPIAHLSVAALRTDSEMESFLSDAETLLSITMPSVHTISKGNPVVYLIDLMATRVHSSHVTCILRQSGIRNRSGGCTSSPYSHHIRTRSHTRGWTHHTHSYYAYTGAIWLSFAPLRLGCVSSARTRV